MKMMMIKTDSQVLIMRPWKKILNTKKSLTLSTLAMGIVKRQITKRKKKVKAQV